MKSTYIKIRIKIQYCLMLVLASLIVLGITVQSCNKEEDMPLVLDEEILNSTELEEFVIAGIDFYQSLAIFSEGLKQLNYFDLEVTYDAEGREIRHIPPAIVGNIKIDEKVNMLNKKKFALQRKFPQLTAYRKDIGKKYFEHSIQHSENVKTVLLKMEIDFSRPKLKSDNEVFWNKLYNAVSEVSTILQQWFQNPNYKELIFVVYQNGDFETVLSPTATPDSTSISLNQPSPNVYYYSGRRVIALGHTHNPYLGDDSVPSQKDKDNKKVGLLHFIVYGYSVIPF